MSGEQSFAAIFAIPNKGIEQMARKNDGACGNPKLIRTDVDCRAARPKFNEGAWSPAKISDMTGGGGLYLFATPDESRPGTLPPSSGGCRTIEQHAQQALAAAWH
jgi:hypothetical protein